MIKDPNCTNRRGYYPIEELDAIILEEIKSSPLILLPWMNSWPKAKPSRNRRRNFRGSYG